MQLPLMLQGDSRVRLIQGAVIGSVLTMVIGFGFSGWQMQTNVERRAELAVNKAVIAVLTPICVDKFRQAADVKATTAALNAVDSWHRETFVEKGGWATFAGSTRPNSGVAEACAKILSGEVK
jgi:hypothetical protein